jgi:hypothetical protein
MAPPTSESASPIGIANLVSTYRTPTPASPDFAHSACSTQTVHANIVIAAQPAP